MGTTAPDTERTVRPPVWRIALWSVVGLLVLLWRSGWGRFPDAEFLATEVVPRLPSLPRMDPLFQYLYWSPIGAWTAWLVRATSEPWFDAVHLVAFAAFAVGVAVLVVRRVGWNGGAVVGAAFVGSQAGVVCLFWVGSYDVFMVGLSSLVVLVRDRRAQFVLGLALAATGAEQAAIVLVLLLALSVVGLVDDRRRLGMTVIGLVLGRLLLWWWLATEDVHHGRLTFLQQVGVSHMLRQFASGLPWLVVTGFGSSVIAIVWALRGRPLRVVVVFVLTIVSALVAVALSEDQTRVLALLTWPLILALLLQATESATPGSMRAVARWTLGVGALMPGVVVWAGHARLATHHALRALLGRQ